MKKILEVCCGSYEDAYNAYMGGASRIELNSALYLGGLTPAIGTLELIKKNTTLEVASMVRPRGAGFNYNDLELLEIFNSAKTLLNAGSDAIVFGFLNSDNTVDFDNTKKMIDLIHSYNKKAVFHRAIDVCNLYIESIGNLANLGIDRILTSGQKDKAIDGVSLIKEANLLYGDKVEIVVGSGVNASNILKLEEETQCYAYHSSCKKYNIDITTSSEFKDVHYKYLIDNSYEVCDIKKVEEIINIIK